MYVCMLRAVCFDKGLKVILEEKERREGVKSQDESPFNMDFASFQMDD